MFKMCNWLVMSLALLGAYNSSAEDTRREEGTQSIESPECSKEFLEHSNKIYSPLPKGGDMWHVCRQIEMPVVVFKVCPDGGIAAAKIVRSSRCAEADHQLLRCLARWRYEPATCSGRAIEEEVYLTVNWGYGPPSEEEEDPCPPFSSPEDEVRVELEPPDLIESSKPTQGNDTDSPRVRIRDSCPSSKG